MYGRHLADYEDEEESLYDVQGSAWRGTVGRGTLEQKQVYDARVDQLSDSLAKVKALYVANDGRDLEDCQVAQESVYDAEGLACNVSVGRGIVEQQTKDDAQLESLEDSIEHVKALHFAKRGAGLNVDNELDALCNVDGTQWLGLATVSALVQQLAYSSKMDELADTIAEFNALYFARSGRDLEGYEDEEELVYVAQGLA